VSWHDDLTSRSSTLYPFGDQRVAGFVDFVNGQLLPYDDDGHGTHVAGVIAGNGYDSNGQKAGAAPDANLVALKVLDANGAGTISSVISALDWVLANHRAYNIRVVNLSAAPVVRYARGYRLGAGGCPQRAGERGAPQGRGRPRGGAARCVPAQWPVFLVALHDRGQRLATLDRRPAAVASSEGSVTANRDLESKLLSMILEDLWRPHSTCAQGSRR
jgi:subtilisin family serine protease